MLRSSLIRRVRFEATHRYAQVDPHRHEFVLEVWVTGPVDPGTGFLVDLEALDHLLEEEVLERFRDRDLNATVPEVASGAMQPSTEELARWIFLRLRDRIPAPGRLLRVRLFESGELGAECEERDPEIAEERR